MVETQRRRRSNSSVARGGPKKGEGLRKARGRCSLYSDADLSTRLIERAALWLCPGMIGVNEISVAARCCVVEGHGETQLPASRLGTNLARGSSTHTLPVANPPGGKTNQWVKV